MVKIRQPKRNPLEVTQKIIQSLCYCVRHMVRGKSGDLGLPILQGLDKGVEAPVFQLFSGLGPQIQMLSKLVFVFRKIEHGIESVPGVVDFPEQPRLAEGAPQKGHISPGTFFWAFEQLPFDGLGAVFPLEVPSQTFAQGIQSPIEGFNKVEAVNDHFRVGETFLRGIDIGRPNVAGNHLDLVAKIYPM